MPSVLVITCLTSEYLCNSYGLIASSSAIIFAVVSGHEIFEWKVHKSVDVCYKRLEFFSLMTYFDGKNDLRNFNIWVEKRFKLFDDRFCLPFKGILNSVLKYVKKSFTHSKKKFFF